MTSLAEAVGRGVRALGERGLPDARLEVEVLLAHAAGLDRAQLYARWSERAADEVVASYEGLLGRRLRGEPLAYLTGHREFFGLDFCVDQRVLIPRPETELLVEAALEWLRLGSRLRRVPSSNQGRSAATSDEPVVVVDVGTGSGAIAISLAAHCPASAVYATDISQDALLVASENARRHGLSERLRFLKGDLLSPLPEPVDLLVANLPYVREDLLPRWCGAAQVELAWEPLEALDGGPDGLAAIRRLLDDAPVALRPGGVVLLEIAWDQGDAVAEMASRRFPGATVEVRRDLAGLDRMVVVRDS